MENNDTICRTCHHLREGQCDGEKEQAACPWYKPWTNGDKIRAMNDEELAGFLHSISRNCWDGTCLTDCPLHCGCAYDSCHMENWLKQEVSE